MSLAEVYVFNCGMKEKMATRERVGVYGNTLPPGGLHVIITKRNGRLEVDEAEALPYTETGFDVKAELQAHLDGAA